jgi:hypothetical protein
VGEAALRRPSLAHRQCPPRHAATRHLTNTTRKRSTRFRALDQVLPRGHVSGPVVLSAFPANPPNREGETSRSPKARITPELEPGNRHVDVATRFATATRRETAQKPPSLGGMLWTAVELACYSRVWR